MATRSAHRCTSPFALVHDRCFEVGELNVTGLKERFDKRHASGACSRMSPRIIDCPVSVMVRVGVCALKGIATHRSKPHADATSVRLIAKNPAIDTSPLQLLISLRLTCIAQKSQLKTTGINITNSSESIPSVTHSGATVDGPGNCPAPPLSLTRSTACALRRRFVRPPTDCPARHGVASRPTMSFRVGSLSRLPQPGADTLCI